jgi:hypothetical protein
MKTTKGSPLGTNNEASRNLQDVRIILAVLWVAGMLSSLNGDTYRLSAMTKFLGANPDLLSILSIILVGHIFMSSLTLILRPHASRWANRIAGIIYAMIIAYFWVYFLVSRLQVYEIVWSTGQLICALQVVWFAWKWPNPEG